MADDNGGFPDNHGTIAGKQIIDGGNGAGGTVLNGKHTIIGSAAGNAFKHVLKRPVGDDACRVSEKLFGRYLSVSASLSGKGHPWAIHDIALFSRRFEIAQKTLFLLMGK